MQLLLRVQTQVEGADGTPSASPIVCLKSDARYGMLVAGCEDGRVSVSLANLLLMPLLLLVAAMMKINPSLLSVVLQLPAALCLVCSAVGWLRLPAPLTISRLFHGSLLAGCGAADNPAT